MSKVASVHISTGVFWAEIVIESTGGTDPITSHGHRKRDAQRIRDLIETYQATIAIAALGIYVDSDGYPGYRVPSANIYTVYPVSWGRLTSVFGPLIGDSPIQRSGRDNNVEDYVAKRATSRSSAGSTPVPSVAHRIRRARGSMPKALRMVGATWAVPTAAFTGLPAAKSGLETSSTTYWCRHGRTRRASGRFCVAHPSEVTPMLGVSDDVRLCSGSWLGSLKLRASEGP